MCSSPAAAAPVYGASHYGAGKAALQYWAATVATEVDSRVLCVVPYAVDTPMVRATIAQPPGATPISDHLRAAAERGELATPEATAAQIWSLVLDDTTHETGRAGRRGARRTEEHDMTAITTTDLVLAERRGAVLVLTLNRPERLNAWTDALEDRYYAHLDAAEDDPEVRAIVVTGAGRGFCAGADLSDLERGATTDGAEAVRATVRAAHFPLTVRKPMIAAINGAAAGLGLVEALYCDVRFATPAGEAHDRVRAPRADRRVRHLVAAAAARRPQRGARPAALRPRRARRGGAAARARRPPQRARARRRRRRRLRARSWPRTARRGRWPRSRLRSRPTSSVRSPRPSRRPRR